MHAIDNTTRAFGDSFQAFSPSLWLAIWDPMLSLEESLEYGYTRLQLIDASSMVSISLDLRRMEMPSRQAAYEYQLTSISSVPANRLTCDLGNPSEYYGPCHVTLLIQFPTFEREVVSVQHEMVWSVCYFMTLSIANTNKTLNRTLLLLWAHGCRFSK